jgi:hypothetical protein
MTLSQVVTLTKLEVAMKDATDNGVLDILCGYIHPDLINTFCDAVKEALDDAQAGKL